MIEIAYINSHRVALLKRSVEAHFDVMLQPFLAIIPCLQLISLAISIQPCSIALFLSIRILFMMLYLRYNLCFDFNAWSNRSIFFTTNILLFVWKIVFNSFFLKARVPAAGTYPISVMLTEHHQSKHLVPQVQVLSMMVPGPWVDLRRPHGMKEIWYWAI